MRRGPPKLQQFAASGASALPTRCSISSKPMAWQRALGARSISRRVMLSVLGCAAVTGPNPQSNRRGSERQRGASNANHHPLRAVALVRELLEIRATERRSSNYLEACAAFWNPEPLRGWVQQLLPEHGLRRGDLARSSTSRHRTVLRSSLCWRPARRRLWSALAALTYALSATRI